MKRLIFVSPQPSSAVSWFCDGSLRALIKATTTLAFTGSDIKSFGVLEDHRRDYAHVNVPIVQGID